MDQESLLTRAHASWLVRCRRNVILLWLAICLATCLAVYLYLNMEVIDSSHEQDRFKPLSRRKPILDHESIYDDHDSGPSMIRLVDLLAHCIVALQVAGQRVVQSSLLHRDKLAQVGSKGRTAEGADDIVTGVDMESHKIIVSLIRDSYRRLKVVSEEDTTTNFHQLPTSTQSGLPLNRVEFARLLHQSQLAIEHQGAHANSLVAQHESLVWIDPLDATKEYSENLTSYVTLMACIVHRSKPIAGVIHKPFTNETYWSLVDTSGTAHYSNDLKMAQARYKEMQQYSRKRVRFIVSRSHAGQVYRFLDDIYKTTSLDLVSAGGSGYKTVELVRGQTDAYIHLTHIKKWDICAPHAILHSLNQGSLTTLEGSEISFGDPKDKVVTGGFIATLNNTLHQEVIGLAKKLSNNQIS